MGWRLASVFFVARNSMTAGPRPDTFRQARKIVAGKCQIRYRRSGCRRAGTVMLGIWKRS
jgi:hypothetical protein